MKLTPFLTLQYTIVAVGLVWVLGITQPYTNVVLPVVKDFNQEIRPVIRDFYTSGWHHWLHVFI